MKIRSLLLLLACQLNGPAAFAEVTTQPEKSTSSAELITSKPSTESQDLKANAFDVYCASEFYTYNECWVGYYIRGVQLVYRHSNSPCIRGYDWGFYNGYIWVDNGCRGTFRVW
jgi:hypothetical protein